MEQPEGSIFLISSINNLTARERYLIELYIAEREHAGHQVRWSVRDYKEDNHSELRIAREKRSAIKQADAIHIWYSPESKEVVFDLAMTVGKKKELHLANPDEFASTTKTDYLSRLIQELISHTHTENVSLSADTILEWQFQESLENIFSLGAFFADMDKIPKQLKLGSQSLAPTARFKERRFDLFTFELAEATRKGRQRI
jgi:hypothetical protein